MCLLAKLSMLLVVKIFLQLADNRSWLTDPVLETRVVSAPFWKVHNKYFCLCDQKSPLGLAISVVLPHIKALSWIISPTNVWHFPCCMPRSLHMAASRKIWNPACREFTWTAQQVVKRNIRKAKDSVTPAHFIFKDERCNIDYHSKIRHCGLSRCCFPVVNLCFMRLREAKAPTENVHTTSINCQVYF